MKASLGGESGRFAGALIDAYAEVSAQRDGLRDELVVPEWVSVKRNGTIAC